MKRRQRGNVGGLDIRLKDSRHRVDLTRGQVAEQVGITASTLADYEIGHRQPSLPVLVSLANIYGVSTDFLLGRDKISPPLPLDTAGLNNEQIDALRHIIRVMKHE